MKHTNHTHNHMMNTFLVDGYLTPFGVYDIRICSSILLCVLNIWFNPKLSDVGDSVGSFDGLSIIWNIM